MQDVFASLKFKFWKDVAIRNLAGSMLWAHKSKQLDLKKKSATSNFFY